MTEKTIRYLEIGGAVAGGVSSAVFTGVIANDNLMAKPNVEKMKNKTHPEIEELKGPQPVSR